MDTLSGKKILVTSGPTRVPLDDVRFISSKSSGRLGVEIARELLAHGASVTFLYGTDSMRPDPGEGVCLIEVETVDELTRTVEGLRGEKFDAIFHAMAVSDFAPESPRKGKVSSQKEEAWDIKLVKTPKVIRLIREIWPDSILVGFKLEVGRSREDLLKTAKNFISSSGADLLVVNDLTEITEDHHVAYLVSNRGEVADVARTKKEIATKLVGLAEKMLTTPKAPSGLRSP
ncbi:MAG: phosphopantothenoylcysteine decarboxylase [Candidatus Brocadiales bacterium]